MKKISTFFPNYRLNPESPSAHLNKICFKYTEVHFVAKIPLFGITETQKKALEWAHYKTPPVISISHGKTTKPDLEAFCDQKSLHHHYQPYAMVTVDLKCIGEENPRKIKIYFCDVTYHEDNLSGYHHSEFKGTWIVPID